VDHGPEITDWKYDQVGNRKRIAKLRKAGVEVWGAERVYVGPEVAEGSIEPGAVLVNTLIRGERTIIGTHSKIGTSGMALVVNTQVGRDVELGAGSYLHATLLDGVKVRGYAEIRHGTVLEEEAEAGHNVGLKHTYFTAGVVAGSCINFCDVLMTGGSSRRDHSEVGSGAVHFNFDPRGDKFGSLIGDASGLLLRKRRIFIGGNSGLVGPVHIDFGAVVAAGSLVRTNVEANRLFCDSERVRSPEAFDPDAYADLRRKFLTTAQLCGNLHALVAWYNLVRLPKTIGMERLLCESAVENVRLHIAHRAKEVDKVIAKVQRSASNTDSGTNAFRRQRLRLVESRQSIYRLLAHLSTEVPVPPDEFLSEYQRARTAMDHCSAIQSVGEDKARRAEEWLYETAMTSWTQLRLVFE
jgi:carbonic anhydrase/acetyltransferase-like protein (isoleucine patch superfamily)